MHVLQIFRIIVVEVWRALANLAWDQDPHCRKKEKKSALAKRKKSANEESEEGMGGGNWRPAFDASNQSSSN